MKRWNTEDENHVLNGILFEIYFNSRGQFRQRDFKCSFIDEIFSSENRNNFEKAFEFITNQIMPFDEFVFYMPFYPPTTLPIEILFKEVSDFYEDYDETVFIIESIKLHNVEIMVSAGKNHFGSVECTLEDFVKKISSELCIPKSQLRLTMNFKKTDLKNISYPFSLSLSKRVHTKLGLNN
ncbi:hypothetical protein G3O08_11855 [Cryomorpha ignava]|uniref:Uncharacterized protein n=1 Tax=Cryomorpha ignava TaxID=101383 RepID=A0A7K3WR95_9FLAO|nr:hypothetical protein [Cryomorpha ignava]NEN24197.1 hypothetical protein [Cryomorpha ignava]